MAVPFGHETGESRAEATCECGALSGLVLLPDGTFRCRTAEHAGPDPLRSLADALASILFPHEPGP